MKSKAVKKKKPGKNLFLAGIIAIFAITIAFSIYTTYFTKESPPIKLSDEPIDYHMYGTNWRKKNPTITPDTRDLTNKIPLGLGNQTVSIQELGIKIQLPEELRGLVYFTEETYGRRFARFSTALLTNADEYCSAYHGPLGSISIIEKSEVVNGKWNDRDLEMFSKVWFDGQNQPHSPIAKDLGEFYIFFEGPQSACSDKEQAFMEMNKLELFKNLIPTIEKL